jgi:hypothetical protein
MNYRNYIECILQEHLLTTNYQQLPNEAALHWIESTKQKLQNAFNLHKNKLTQAEVNYFTRSFTGFHRNPVFMVCLKFTNLHFCLELIPSHTYTSKALSMAYIISGCSHTLHYFQG